MKHYREKLIPEKTVMEETHRTCDSCGAAIPGEVWDGVYRKHDETKIERKEGDYWPDGANVLMWEFDCCRACWESKVMPVFALKGSEPEEVGW